MEFWFEAVPSPAGASAGRIAKDAAAVAGARDAGATRILVPEVVDTGHEAIDPIEFAIEAADASGLPVGIAVVTARRTDTEIAQRIERAADAGIDTLLLVGAGRGEARPGPAVTSVLAAHPHHDLGVVTIPGRRSGGIDEAERLYRKRQAGAAFAVSQIAFDPEKALALRRSYVDRDPDPLPIYYSLAPLRTEADVRFLQSLGVEIPDALAQVQGADAREAAARQVSLDTARALAAQGGACGFVVSHVMLRNVEAGTRLLAALREALRPAVTT